MTSLTEHAISELTPAKGQIKPIYRLRWVFRFHDGKTRRGVWNAGSNRFEDSAASINKTNLILASIESEHFYGNGVKTMFHCDGHDYVTAKWLAAAGAGSLVKAFKDSNGVEIYPDIIGLSFLTRTKRVSVLVNGKVIESDHKTNEKIDNIREHNLN